MLFEGFGDSGSVTVGFQTTKGEISKLMSNSSRNLAIENHLFTYYQLDVYDQRAMSDVLKDSIDQLPSTPDEGPYMYVELSPCSGYIPDH
jgi:hypothetical protein